MRPLLLFYLGYLVIGSTFLFGQKENYNWGYVITEKKDTLQGWVNDRSEQGVLDLYDKIRFKQKGKLFKKRLSPSQILGYGYLDEHFVSLPLAEENQFLKVYYHLRTGGDRQFLKAVIRTECLHYYEVEFVQDFSYFDSFPLFHIPGTKEMVRVTQGIFGLKKKRLAEYFRTCPELVTAIENKEISVVMEVFEFYCQRCNKTRTTK